MSDPEILIGKLTEILAKIQEATKPKVDTRYIIKELASEGLSSIAAHVLDSAEIPADANPHYWDHTSQEYKAMLKPLDDPHVA